MDNVCGHCSKEIVRLNCLVTCPACHTVFHKGCLKLYKSKATAKSCCASVPDSVVIRSPNKKLSQNLSHFVPRNCLLDLSVESISLNNIESMMNSGASDLSTSVNQISELPSEWNNVSGEEKIDKLILCLLNANSQINTKLDNLTQISARNSKTLKTHDKRINEVTSTVDHHTREIDSIKLALAYSNPTSDMWNDNIPVKIFSDLKSVPENANKFESHILFDIAAKIVTHVGANNVVEDCLELSQFFKKSTNKNLLTIKIRSNHPAQEILPLKKDVLLTP